MKPVNLSELTNQELIEEEKKQKRDVIIFRVIMCLLMGVAVWNATHKGSFLISCLPIFCLTFFIESENNYKAVQTEIQSRKSS